MTITLHQLSGSPFSWRVQLALGHKGLEFEATAVRFGEGEHRSPEFRALNPRSKVPVLVDGEVVLYESVAILEYLEDRYPDRPRLYPTDVADRARVRRLICEIDNYWWTSASKLSGNLYFKQEAGWDLNEIEAGRAGVAAELEYLEGQIRGPGFAGELGAADYALYPFLAHLARYERRKSDLGLTDKVGPQLRTLMRTVEERPFYEATYPPHWR